MAKLHWVYADEKQAARAAGTTVRALCGRQRRADVEVDEHLPRCKQCERAKAREDAKWAPAWFYTVQTWPTTGGAA